MFNVANGKRAEDNPFRTSWCARPSSTRLTATPSTKWPAAASSSRRSDRSRPPVPITATSSRRPSATWPRPRAAQAGGLRAREGRGHVRQQHHHLVGGRDGAGHGVRGRLRPVAAPDRVRRAAEGIGRRQFPGGDAGLVRPRRSGRQHPRFRHLQGRAERRSLLQRGSRQAAQRGPHGAGRAPSAAPSTTRPRPSSRTSCRACTTTSPGPSRWPGRSRVSCPIRTA